MYERKRNTNVQSSKPMRLEDYKPSTKLANATSRLTKLLKEMQDGNTACIDRFKCQE